jgi:hypothetical protein
LQALVNSPVARDFGEFSDPVYELSGGIKYRWCDSVMLQLSLTENFFTFKNSADIAVHLGVEFGL